MAVAFQRARTDEQREARREHILAVVRELLGERRVADVGLNELSRHVGLAKSNVLRYFGSREAILLELTRREYTAWVDDLVATGPHDGAGSAGLTGPAGSADSAGPAGSAGPVGPVESAEPADSAEAVERLAARIARTAVSRPLLAELLANLMTTVEHNVTPREIADFKLAIYEQAGRLRDLVEAVVGPLPEAARLALIPGIHALITEFHSLARPSPALQRAAAANPCVIAGFAGGVDHADALTSALTLYLDGARAAAARRLASRR